MASEADEAQFRLLVRVLPVLGNQPQLALKGGAAINMFDCSIRTWRAALGDHQHGLHGSRMPGRSPSADL